jgi:diguanylate cyclase (GGDEF)-like protein
MAGASARHNGAPCAVNWQASKAEGDELDKLRHANELLRQQFAAAQSRIDALFSRNATLKKRLQRTLRDTARAQDQACRDELTGLPNRRLMKDRMEQAIARADREQTSIALLVIDLNGFKAVNDSLGHAAGDSLLRAVAARLSACTRASDTICRYGGDEFVVLLPDTAGNAAMGREVDKLRALGDTPFLLAGKEISIGLSIGAASYPADGANFSEVIHQADLAMYRNKMASRAKADRS